jgi:hypothetical protein
MADWLALRLLLAGVTSFGLAGAGNSAESEVKLTKHDVAHALNGSVCTTRGGAKFTFSRAGEYAYDGMWQNHGTYRVAQGAITVMLDNGLQRDFTIRRQHGALYMETTVITCAPQAKFIVGRTKE